MSARYLIVGASGLVGARLLSLLGSADAVATYCSRPVEGGVRFDASRMRLADTVLRDGALGYTHAFVLMGITGIDACARDPAGTARVNVDAVCRVIDDLVDNGIVPVFASSDAVFDGTCGMRREDDPVNPALTYGRQKLAVERHLQGKSSPWVIARLAKVVGAGLGHPDMLGDWMRELETGAVIRCARDQVFSPVHADDAARALAGLAARGATGLFHVCGPQALSRLDLLNLLVEEMGNHCPGPARIEPCSLRDFDFAEPRPLDASMSPAKLNATLGWTCGDMRSACRRAVAWRYGASRATLTA